MWTRPNQALALLLTIVLIVAAAAKGGTELTPEVLLLSRIKRLAREGLSQIPAYACQESVERFSRGSRFGRFIKKDGFRVQVAQIGDRELFARPGDKEFQDKPLSDMVGPGMVATGLFYAMAHAVFLSSATIFTYHGPENRAGRKVVRYDYRIAQLFSSYQISSNGVAAQVGMEGSIWADAETNEPLEVEVRATDVPARLLIRNTTTKIMYNPMRLGEHTYLLPASAVITTITQSGVEDQNRTEFHDCHRYTGESKITF